MTEYDLPILYNHAIVSINLAIDGFKVHVGNIDINGQTFDDAVNFCRDLERLSDILDDLLVKSCKAEDRGAVE